MEQDKNNFFAIVLTQKMCTKTRSVKPGDTVIVNLKKRGHAGALVLVSKNEEQWVERYSNKLKDKNTYLISKVIMSD